MKLSYLQQGFGSALPLVLLHPFPLHSHFWRNQLSGLSRERHVIAPSFRGYGASILEPSDPITIAACATDIRKTMKNLKIPKAIFAGCSMGGYILFEMWRQEKELIAGMALIDTRAEPDDDAAKTKRRDLIEKINETGSSVLPDIVAGYLSETTRLNNPAIERDVRLWASQTSPDTAVKSLQMLADRPDSRPTLSQIDAPTLVIVGEDDNITPPDAAKVINHGIKDSTLVTIPDAGHFAPLENAVAVNQAMNEFMANVDQGSSTVES